jgi:hypothetical protein
MLARLPMVLMMWLSALLVPGLEASFSLATCSRSDARVGKSKR